MGGDDLAQRLHDTATRGGSLSAEEQALLEAWYAGQDREEAAALGQDRPDGKTLRPYKPRWTPRWLGWSRSRSESRR